MKSALIGRVRIQRTFKTKTFENEIAFVKPKQTNHLFGFNVGGCCVLKFFCTLPVRFYVARTAQLLQRRERILRVFAYKGMKNLEF